MNIFYPFYFWPIDSINFNSKIRVKTNSSDKCWIYFTALIKHAFAFYYDHKFVVIVLGGNKPFWNFFDKRKTVLYWSKKCGCMVRAYFSVIMQNVKKEIIANKYILILFFKVYQMVCTHRKHLQHFSARKAVMGNDSGTDFKV